MKSHCHVDNTDVCLVLVYFYSCAQNSQVIKSHFFHFPIKLF